MGHVIGCDIGSQSAKAVLMSPEGEILASASAPYSMKHLHDGWADQDPADYRASLAVVIRAVLEKTGTAGPEVSHLALSSQVDGVVALDGSNRPLRDAIIWLDRRATVQANQLAARIDGARLFDLTGLNLDASHTAPKMMWLVQEEPDTYRASKSLVSVGGYAVAWMTGRPIQDHANASSTLVYDVRGRRWSDELIELTGLDGDKLPEIGAAHDPAGTLLPDVAAELGLSTDCVVLVSTGDDHAACLGAGGVTAGVVVDIVGTAEPVGVASDTPEFDSTRLVETHAHAVDGKFLIENPGFVSGGNTLWLSKNILGVPQGELFTLAEDSVPGARGVRFIPALSGAMAPRWNDHVRGSFTGLGMNHTSADLARAVIEANVFAFRDIYDRLDAMGLAKSVRMVGGGSRSALWMQTKATLCGTPIDRVRSDETSALGAAMLAGTAAGYFADLDEAVDRVVEVAEDAVEPDPSTAGVLEEAYQEYRAVYDALEPVYQKGQVAA